MQIKLESGKGFDAYKILQGQSCPILNSLIAKMGEANEVSMTVHIPRKGKYLIRTYSPSIDPYTRYNNSWMISKAP